MPNSQPRFTLSNEIARKALHIFFVYPIFFLNEETKRFVQISLVIFGIMFYIFEHLRLRNTMIPFVWRIIARMYRPHEVKKFTYAPLTLMIGIALGIQIFDTEVAKLAIIAVAIGDTMAAIAGTISPIFPLFWNKNKSLGGILGCFISVFAVNLLYVSPMISLFVALCTCLTESLNLEDLDNLVIPLSVGTFLYLTFY